MNCALLAWAADQTQLTPHLQGILLRMVRMMAPDGSLTLPQAAIAKGIRLGETQTRAAIKALVAGDVLLRTRRGSVGKGRACDVLTANLERQHDNRDVSTVSPDNSDTAPVPSKSEKSQNSGSVDKSTLSRRRTAALSALSALSAVDNSGPACIGTGARAELEPKLTTDDKIRSDLIVGKEMLDGLIERVGAACDPTAPNLHHAADINRLIRAGCDWEADILPAVDKLAASFRRRGKKLQTWELLAEHALEFRDRRVAGLPPPAPPTARQRSNGVRRNIYLEAVNA